MSNELENALRAMWNSGGKPNPDYIQISPWAFKVIRRLVRVSSSHIGGCSARRRKRIVSKH